MQTEEAFRRPHGRSFSCVRTGPRPSGAELAFASPSPSGWRDAGAAEAGPLLQATWTQDLQGIAITVTNSGATCTDTNPAHVPGAGFVICPIAGLQATGSVGGTSYNVSLTMPLFQMQAFTTGGAINIGTMATFSGAQSIAGNAFSAAGTPGIAGTVLVGGAMHTMGSMWSQPAGQTLVQIPLSVGKAGVFTGTFLVLGSYHYITVDFYAWTPGTVTFTGLTTMGQALPDVVAMGSFAIEPSGTNQGQGTITLVAPSKISIDGPAAQRRTASFTSLHMLFLRDGGTGGVPEPSTLLLFGAGALGVLCFARRS